jgi:polysaccharide export outer membrane protein
MRGAGWTGAALVAVLGGAGGISCHQGARPDDGLRANDCKIDLNDTQLGPGDVFDIRVYEEPQLSGLYRVSADGSINFPLIGQVQVEKQTPPELGKTLEARLADGYLRSPHVSIFVKEYNSKRISVLGQVNKPGTFPYTDSMNVIEAVTLAGGFTPIAAKNDTVVTRSDGNAKTRVQVRVESISEGHDRNFCLRPGDIVFVPERVF